MYLWSRAALPGSCARGQRTAGTELADDVGDGVRGADAAAETGQRDEPYGVDSSGPEGRQALDEARIIALYEQAIDEFLRDKRGGGLAASGTPGRACAVDRVLVGDRDSRGPVGRHRHVRRNLPPQPLLRRFGVRPRLRPD